MRSDTRFDIIEADAFRPGSAHAGHLYSKGYFELLRSRLADGGLAVTWAPTPRIERTFALVFPHVASVLPMLLGSNTPIVFDGAAITDRASDPHVQAHFGRAGLSLGEQLEKLLSTFEHRQPRQTPPDGSMLNTDLFPRDELRTPIPELRD